MSSPCSNCDSDIRVCTDCDFYKGKYIRMPDNATNGDVIKAMFPNLKTGADPYIPSVDIYVGGILMMRVDRYWWNAPYKAGDTE